jgi:hypothetical protein
MKAFSIYVAEKVLMLAAIMLFSVGAVFAQAQASTADLRGHRYRPERSDCAGRDRYARSCDRHYAQRDDK